jgi:hypothetical protein
VLPCAVVVEVVCVNLIAGRTGEFDHKNSRTVGLRDPVVAHRAATHSKQGDARRQFPAAASAPATIPADHDIPRLVGLQKSGVYHCRGGATSFILRFPCIPRPLCRRNKRFRAMAAKYPDLGWYPLKEIKCRGKPCPHCGSLPINRQFGYASSFSIGKHFRNVMQVTAVLLLRSILSGILLCESEYHAFHF